MRVKVRSSQKMGKGCGYVFFGVFALAGILALIGVGSMVWEGLRSRFWTPTPATIVRSEVKPEHGDFVLDLGYFYTFNGREFTGTRLRPGHTDFEQKRDADRAQQRYRSDRRVTCYVNPDNPEESYLERQSPFYAFFLLIPLVFIAVGVGGIYAMHQSPQQKPRAISDRHKKGAGAWGLRLFGGIFMLVGGGFAYGVGIGPWLEARAASDWKEVPCTITESRVSSHRPSKGGTSHTLVIQYAYTVEGQTYTSDRYNFGIDSSGTRAWRDRAAQAYPEGKQTVCYVNPAEPSEAVLVREAGIDWLILIPGVFFIVGLLIFLAAGSFTSGSKGRAIPRAASAPAGNVGGLRGTIGDSTGPVSLTPSGSRLGGFIVLLIFALFWNGIVFGVLFLADTPTAVKVFLSIFALIGVLIFGAAIHQFLSLFNPRPSVHASASVVRLGQSIEVRYSFAGRTQRIQRLKITFKGEEVATYRRGTDTRTDRKAFHETTLLDTRDHGTMQAGAVTITVPAESMHSFDAPNNKIEWKLILHGDIPRWPDVDLNFPIIVHPHPIS